MFPSIRPLDKQKGVIAYLHPVDVHAGTADQIVTARQEVLDGAYADNPERFRNHRPRAASPPTEAWITKPTVQTKP